MTEPYSRRICRRCRITHSGDPFEPVPDCIAQPTTSASHDWVTLGIASGVPLTCRCPTCGGGSAIVGEPEAPWATCRDCQHVGLTQDFLRPKETP